uniref:Uncharacterized protein n=1 Tax=Eutreptiella gymnastica TaxID=73025 RepID=A0A7S4GK78_9EUGL
MHGSDFDWFWLQFTSCSLFNTQMLPNEQNKGVYQSVDINEQAHARKGGGRQYEMEGIDLNSALAVVCLSIDPPCPRPTPPQKKETQDGSPVGDLAAEYKRCHRLQLQRTDD